MVTDEELKSLLTRFESKYNRYKSKHDKSIYDTLDLVEKGKVLTVNEFKQIFKGKKFNYGIGMLNKVLNKNYIYSVNRRYKTYIEKTLYAMGLSEQAESVNKMGMTEFLDLYEQGVWDNVKEKYNTVRETVISEHTTNGVPQDIRYNTKTKKPVLKKDIYKLDAKTRKELEEKLGF